MEEFHRIRRLPPYVFEQVNRAKAIARNAGADIIDLGMGNPDLPTPGHVIEKLKDTLGKPRTDRYSASRGDRKSTRLNSSHLVISYAVFCLKKKKKPTYYLLYKNHTPRRQSSTMIFS